MINQIYSLFLIIVEFIQMRESHLKIFFFFLSDPAPTEIYPLPLHDPLPIYQVLSPATKIKPARLPMGKPMVRPPHFAQPIFVRFPRPAPLRGRDGVERFPPAADLPFEEAVVRQLLRLDRRIRPNQVKDVIADRRAEDVRGALAAVRRARPEDVLAYFRKALGTRVAPTAPRPRQVVPPLNPISEEPY